MIILIELKLIYIVLNFYLKKLLDKNIVEERELTKDKDSLEAGKPQKGIYVIRPDKIVHLVVMYKSGFFDDLSNRILDLVEVI